MNCKITLVIGGQRSGKSRWAQEQAEKLTGEKYYIATAPVLDNEMRIRVLKHQEQRDRNIWTTIEEEYDLLTALTSILQKNSSGTDTSPIILVECITLWINNLLYRFPNMKEEEVQERVELIMKQLYSCKGEIFLVTNQVGEGVIPQDPVSRLYVDLVGTANRVIASYANRVVVLNCGIPWAIKGTLDGK